MKSASKPGTVSPTVLVVLDGYGERKERNANAIALASTPNLDRWMNEYPHSQLQASGLDVGLPPGQMGNSEVGHLNLGAGRVIYQDITRISKAIQDREFFSNAELKTTLNIARDRSLHLVGLLSDGGVHSSLDHLEALLRAAADASVRRVYLHVFTDGRDTPPKSALGFIQRIEASCVAIGVGEIATVSGRFYGMDRDKRWERVARAYQVLTMSTLAPNIPVAESAAAAVQLAYERNETDEFIQPTVIMSGGSPRGPIAAGDAVVFFNFRADRARQITRALALDDFKEFPRPKGWPKPGKYLCLTQYDETLPLPAMFPPTRPTQTLGELVAAAGLRQLRIAETEKYAHVTYFFNGGEERAFDGEDRVLVPSPRDIETYDQRPVMSLREVTEKCVERIRSGEYGFVLVNFANPDMLGHTGVLPAAITAIEEVDRGLAAIVEAALERKGRVLVTADHGNCELMVDPETGEPHTAHTTNPVPLLLIDPDHRTSKLKPGALCDVAPTLIQLMGLKQPSAMKGVSLLKIN